MDHAKGMLPASVQYATGTADVLAGADAAVLLTEWNEFRALPPEKLRAAMRGTVFQDLRNVYDPAAMRAAGFRLWVDRAALAQGRHPALD